MTYTNQAVQDVAMIARYAIDRIIELEAKRKPLTDEQIAAIWELDTTSAEDCRSLHYAKVIAREVERAHGIGEKE